MGKESTCILEESCCLYLLCIKTSLKSPFNQSCCPKGRAKIVKVQRRAVKIICGMQGRRRYHGRRNSKCQDHFIGKGKLPETQCLQHNKLTTGIGKANQDLTPPLPPTTPNTRSRLLNALYNSRVTFHFGTLSK